MFRILVLTLAILALVPVAGATGASPATGRSAPSQARSVSVWDAKQAPSVSRYLPAGASVSYTRACRYHPRIGRVLTESSAYRVDGRAMGPQRWNAAHDLTYWTHPAGGRVTFDGITFHNATRRSVIVAGWCS